MAHRSTTKIYRWFPALLLGLIVLAACTGTPTPIAASPSPGEESTGTAATATAIPTEPPTAAPDKLLVIGDPAASDPQQSTRIEWLREFAAQNGLAFEARPVLETSGLADEIRLVLFLEPVGDVSPLLAAAPETQFVAVGSAETQAGGNFSVVVADDTQIAFLAGYIAEMISGDYRAAGLFAAERSDLVDAFQNGGRYLCGRCVPIYAPVVFFPLTGTAPAGSPPASWIGAFDEVHKNRIETVFLSSQAASAELMTSLVQQEIEILGDAPPPDEFKSAWVATIQVDLNATLETLLPDLLNGSGGQTARAAVVLGDVDENRITPGKRQQIQQIIDDLAGGWIYPQSVPLE